MTAVGVAAWVAIALLLIWGGYPLALAVVIAIRGRRPNPDSAGAALPRVTVIVATREAAPVVRERVADLLTADYPPELLDVVVAIDARHESLVAELQDLPARVRVVPGDAPGGKAAALNAGVRAAQGDVLVFADSYQRFAADAVRRLAIGAVPEGVGAVSGNLVLESVTPGSPIDWYWRYEVWLRTLEGSVSSVVGVFGPIWAMRRSLWLPLPAGVILDDVYTPMRLVLDGRRVTIERAAIATELRNPTPVQEYRRKVRTLTGVLQLCAWLPGVLSPARNPIWLQFVFHKLLRLLSSYLVLALVIAVAVAVAGALDGRALAVPLASLAVVLLLVLVQPRAARRIGDAVASLVTLQAAVVVAAYNGVRGRWDVWRR